MTDTYSVVKIEKGHEWSRADRKYTDLQLSFKEGNILEIIDNNNGELISGNYSIYFIDENDPSGIIISFGMLINDTMNIINDHFEYIIKEGTLILKSRVNKDRPTIIYLEEK